MSVDGPRAPARAGRWLDPVREALDGAPGPVTWFFRDDDAGWADERQLAMADAFEQRGVLVDLAAIPDAVGAPLGRELAARARRGALAVHQHGARHANHEPTGRKCEFGTARTPTDQLADIAWGQRRLRDSVGDVLQPIFTPPWNRCTAETGAALVACGIAVLSRDRTALKLHVAGLRELPIDVDWFATRKGRPLGRAAVVAQIAERVRQGGPVGVMLHHAVTGDDELAAVAELVGLVASHPRARSSSIAAVAGLSEDWSSD